MPEEPWDERFRRRKLPHWEIAGGRYFVTFRLAGSLPASVLAEMQERGAGHPPGGNKPVDHGSAGQMPGATWKLTDAWLDRAKSGPQHLGDPAVAQTIVDTLWHYHGSRYELLAYVIMPNHVHLLLQPLQKNSQEQYWGLDEILRSIKGYTGKWACQYLKIPGPFWQREYYDHRIRDIDEFAELKEYIHLNPVRAGLCTEPEKWPWGSAFVGPGIRPAEQACKPWFCRAEARRYIRSMTDAFVARARCGPLVGD